jgi:hypothetical protein
MVDCNSFNNNIKISIVFIMIIILVISFLFILILNIINSILFSIYCINDIIIENTSEEPENIILEDLYKYRLLKYVINLSYLNKNNNYNVKYDYDKNSSDLYIHNVIVYYNYIVKLLLLIIILLFIGFIYNMFNLLITVVNNAFCKKNDTCEIIFTEIYNNHPYIYYIIIIIFLYIYLHSYIYTYVFNKSIYKDIYDIYESENQTTDFILSDSISLLNNTNDTKSIEEDKIVLFIDDLKNLSYKKLYIKIFLDKKNNLHPNSNDKFKELIDYGITNNYKFIIPNDIMNDNKTNILLKNICDIKSDNENSQKILGYKIFIYLIYHYVISHNRDDPFIIHKLNNIYLNIFENISKEHIYHYNENNKKQAPIPDEIKKVNDKEENQSIYTNFYNMFNTEKEEEEDKNTSKQEEDKNTSKQEDPTFIDVKSNNIDYIIDLINNIDNIGIKNMYNDIKSSYTIKLLLPESTKTKNLSDTLHNNAKLLIGYIKKNLEKRKGDETDAIQKTNLTNIIKKLYYDNEVKYNNEEYLQNNIKDKINEFAGTFHDYYLENEEKNIVNFNLYKIRFYLTIEMLQTIFFILIVLIILYRSKKYPYIEMYINTAISLAIIIVHNVITSILGIYFL